MLRLWSSSSSMAYWSAFIVSTTASWYSPATTTPLIMAVPVRPRNSNPVTASAQSRESSLAAPPANG